MVEMGSDSRFLSPGERIVTVINFHPVIMLRQFIAAVAVFSIGVWGSADGQGWGTVLVLGSLVYLVGAFLDYRLQKLVLTDKRLFKVEGVITRKVSTMRLSALTDVRYFRSPAGLLFGWGTFDVETAGQNQALNVVNYVPKPDQFYGSIVRLVF